MQATPFTSPGYDYSADLSAIERKKKLAEALQAQAMQPIEQQPVGQGQFAVPISPWQGAAKLMQAFAAARQGHKAEDQQRTLSKKAQTDYSDMVRTGIGQLYGSAGKTIQPDPQENQQAADQGTPEVAAKTIPAVAPNPAAALSTFGAHPMGASFSPLAVQELQRQSMLAGGSQPPAQAQPGGAAAAAGGTAPSYGSPGFDPNAAPTSQQRLSQSLIGKPAGGIPYSEWIGYGDPMTGRQKYLEQLAKDNQEAGKPVINRGYGVGTMQNGKYVPDQASIDQALSMERGKQGISAPMESPVTLKTSEGREIQLSRPEWAEYQKTQQLPARFGGGQPQPAQPSQQPFGAPKPLTAAGVNIGIPGITQTQQQQSEQAAQMAGNTAAGKEQVEHVMKEYGRLRGAPVAVYNLQNAQENLKKAGPFVGSLAEQKLGAVKFLNNNFGMNIKPEAVQSTEVLRTELFRQVMDNLKKLDASPSQEQQRVLAQSLGTLANDPAALPKVLSDIENIIRADVGVHNKMVGNMKGINWAFNPTVRLEGDTGVPGSGPGLSAATKAFMKANGIAIPGE